MSTAYREERDSMGVVQVSADALWGAQTERSRQNFAIGDERMPKEIIYALALIKAAAAHVNGEDGRLEPDMAAAIEDAARAVFARNYDEAFPLKVWQTGSGTQTNMNVNEVIAHLATHQLSKPIHPNDHVNKSQSSNDVFPSALHIAAAHQAKHDVLPALTSLIEAFKQLEEKNTHVYKCGRTHLQDAVPLSFAQEISGWRALLEQAETGIKEALSHLMKLPLGGTAVGTGLNAQPDFGPRACAYIAKTLEMPFEQASNLFAEMSGKDALARYMSALKVLACALNKISCDIRFLASGPRTGISEISIPANEPGSSIMPGKVNPTQVEAITMIYAEVMGSDTTVSIAAASGMLELNVMMPVIGYNVIKSARLLSDGMTSFRVHLVDGIEPNAERMQHNLENSLMLVTALAPHLGYTQAATLAHDALTQNKTLRELVSERHIMDLVAFDELMDPARFVGEKN